MTIISRARRWPIWYAIPAGVAGGVLWYGKSSATSYQRVWLLLLAGAAAAIVAGLGLYRSRQRGMNRIYELERKHALELERLRIAQDMHDSLGADLSRIALLAEMARYQRNPAEALQQIEKVAIIARSLVDSINELVWATDPHHNSIDALAAYLREYAAELLEPTGLGIRFDIPDRLPSGTISGELRRHLFLATKEALNNVLKHAQATEVRFAFDATLQRVKVVVEDNGCGFCSTSEMPGSLMLSPVNPAGSGNGLRNLHKRLSAVGGCVQINSVPGCGTCVAFTVPITNHPNINGAKYDQPAPVPIAGLAVNRKTS